MIPSGAGVLAFIPGRRFVSISVTGSWCGLKCSFCLGRYLSSMISSETPEKLRDIVLHYYNNGVRGFLISGGFNREGYLPISREFISYLKEFRRMNQVFLSVHLGLAPRDLIDRALEVFDLIDYEVPPSSEYIRHGRGINTSIEDYLKLLEYVTKEYGEDRISPHIVISSPLALLHQELDIVKEVSLVYRKILVLLLHVGEEHIEELRVLKVAQLSRSLFKEVSLGCMRPRKNGEIIYRLISSGYLDRVVNPGRSIIERYRMQVVHACCSIPRQFFKLFE